MEAGPSLRQKRMLEITERFISFQFINTCASLLTITHRNTDHVENLKMELQSQFKNKIEELLRPKMEKLRVQVTYAALDPYSGLVLTPPPQYSSQAQEERLRVKRILREKRLDEYVEGELSDDEVDSGNNNGEETNKATGSMASAGAGVAGASELEIELSCCSSDDDDGNDEDNAVAENHCGSGNGMNSVSAVAADAKVSTASEHFLSQRPASSQGGVQRKQLRSSLLSSARRRGAARRAEKLLGRNNCAQELLLVLKYNQLQRFVESIACRSGFRRLTFPLLCFAIPLLQPEEGHGGGGIGEETCRRSDSARPGDPPPLRERESNVFIA